jgi:hypothetical protein
MQGCCLLQGNWRGHTHIHMHTTRQLTDWSASSFITSAATGFIMLEATGLPRRRIKRHQTNIVIQYIRSMGQLQPLKPKNADSNQEH